jgi:acyl-coenzyme A thioesterase PaaI-like protein
MSVEGEHVEDRRQQRQASPEAEARIRKSFDRRGLMAHLGGRITRIAPGGVRIELPSRPEVTRQRPCSHAATSTIADSADGCAALTLFPENTEVLVANGRQTPIRVNRSEQ